MRTAGSDKFNDKGQPVLETIQQGRRKETYVVYHVSDLNMPTLAERTPPGQGRSQVERWKKENPGREPDAQAFEAIKADMAQRKVGTALESLEKSGVNVTRDAGKLDEARFSLDKNGKGTLALPPAETFRDLDHQVSSIYQAVAHANIAREAQRVAAGAPEGAPDKAAEDRVAAYKLSPSKQAKSPAYAEAELVASYAALHETTGLGLEYNPAPSVTNAEMQERWADKLQRPGGYADVNRQVTRTVKLDEEMMPSRANNRFKTREELAGPEQAGRSAADIGARAAAALRQEQRVGGDPNVPQPAQRPASGGTPGGGQTQARESEKQTR